MVRPRSVPVLAVLFPVLFALGPAVSRAQVATELAGNPLAEYPFFEYVKAFNANAPVHVAVDPALHPEVRGKTADIWVVEARTLAEWKRDPVLHDVRTSGPQEVTFSGDTVQENTVEIAAADTLEWRAREPATRAMTGLGHGYDVVVDLDRDGRLSGGDLVDGYSDEAGFYVVGDTTAPGPLEVVEVPPYSVGTVFGIPADETMEVCYYPATIRDMDPRPLVVISHGSGHDYRWYGHIGRHLASWGYIVMSHQNMDHYATHRHTDAFLDQQGTIAGGVLAGKIDSHRIVWIGHSYGAISITRAYNDIYLGNYHPTHYTLDDLVLLSSMLPPGGKMENNETPRGANYHLWTASGDTQVSGSADCDLCQTFHLYERAEGWRMSTVVQGTGHAWFHDGQETWDWFEGPCPIGQDGTHLVQLGLFLPLVKYFCEGSPAATDFFWRQYERFHPIGVDTSNPCFVVTNEWRPHPRSGYAVIDDFETGTEPNVSSSGGRVTGNVQHFTEGRLDDNNEDFAWTSSDPFNGVTLIGPEENDRGIVFDWNGSDVYLEWEIVPGLSDFTRFDYLSFRGAQGTRHPLTTARLGDLDFTVTIRDADGHQASIRIGAYGGGIEEPYQRQGGWHDEFERVRLRLEDFLANGSGVDLARVAAVRFSFGPSFGSPEGRLVLDELFLEPDAAEMRGGWCHLGEATITRVERIDDDGLRFTWDPAWGLVSGYDLYVGTLGSLRDQGTYDHVKEPGGETEFPDSPTPATGCDAAGGASTTARVTRAPADSYWLVVAWGGGTCEGPYGLRSDGKDRHDPSVDPRPADDFCP